MQGGKGRGGIHTHTPSPASTPQQPQSHRRRGIHMHALPTSVPTPDQPQSHICIHTCPPHLHHMHSHTVARSHTRTRGQPDSPTWAASRIQNLGEHLVLRFRKSCRTMNPATSNSSSSNSSWEGGEQQQQGQGHHESSHKQLQLQQQQLGDGSSSSSKGRGIMNPATSSSSSSSSSWVAAAEGGSSRGRGVMSSATAGGRGSEGGREAGRQRGRPRVCRCWGAWVCAKAQPPGGGPPR